MRTFKFEASEVIPTETGAGFKSTTLTLTTENDGTFVSLIPEKQQGYIEGAPDPGGEATL